MESIESIMDKLWTLGLRSIIFEQVCVPVRLNRVGIIRRSKNLNLATKVRKIESAMDGKCVSFPTSGSLYLLKTSTRL